MKFPFIFDQIRRDWNQGKNRYIFEDALVRQIRYALQEQTENFWFISAMEEFMWTVRENTILRKR